MSLHNGHVRRHCPPVDTAALSGSTTSPQYRSRNSNVAVGPTNRHSCRHVFRLRPALTRAEKYDLALGKYRRAVTLLEHDALEGDLKERRNALLLATHLNMALCHSKLNDPLEAIRACNSALGLDPRSEKALFRRGQAYIATNDFELARKDFEEVLKIDSNNKAARNQLSICTVKLKQQLQKERQMYKHIFERMAAQNNTNAPPSAAKEPGKDDPLEPGVWNRSDENSQEAATPEESKTAIEADKEVPPPPESVPAST
ncbi:hypothetical protein HPB51_017146 [Rhipicephalus microplus]|uniref:peptidylprolyl isomerase n=1 Tax=Rhipicephalus microplus TaxID=6941 RepID=A0A9J6DVX8_RHIMP|nr:hypothetical protein HPB51_017146 [Rhipicephalus microplus]